MNALERQKDDLSRLVIPEREVNNVIKHRAKQSGILNPSVDLAIERTRRLYDMHLEESDILLPIGGKEIGALAYMLLTGFKSVIPICLDHSHTMAGGRTKYTFETIGGGVSPNVKIMLDKTPQLFRALFETGATVDDTLMLVSDLEAQVLAYQNMSQLTPQQIRDQGLESIGAINKVLPYELSFVTVGLMSDFAMVDINDVGQLIRAISGGAIDGIISSRKNLYSTQINRLRSVGAIDTDLKGPTDYDGYIRERAHDDLKMYISLGLECRTRGYVIIDGTAPTVASYYNIPVSDLPPTPLIRIIDDYD